MRYLIAVALVCLVGCTSTNRNLFGDNIAGQNAELGKKSVEASMLLYRDAVATSEASQHIQTATQCLNQSGTLLGSLEQTVQVEAPQTHEKIVPQIRQIDALLGNTSEELDLLGIKLEAHKQAMEELAAFTQFTAKAAQGKTYRSKTKILMYQILGISIILFIAAIALAAFGLLAPVRTFLGGLFGLAANLSNGGFKAMQETVAEMAHKDDSIPSEKLHPSLKAAIVSKNLKS